MNELARTPVVFRKEMKDHLRDRRSLISALLMPLVGPLLFGAMFSIIASWSRTDRALEIPLRGAQHAPGLVAFLERHGARVTPAPDDYEARVREGQLDLAVVVPEEYPEQFTSGETAKLRVVLDTSRNRSRPVAQRVQALLEGYNRQLGTLRLLARGVSPQVAQPVAVTPVDLATPEKQAANALGMVPLFLLMAVFMGGMNVAIDSTAGERERGSLEPLLLNPVTRAAVVTGKWLCAVVVSWIAVGVTLAGFMVALTRVPLEDLGLRARIGGPELLGILAIMIPLTLFAGSLQMLIATFARTFKEAQTYISLLFLVPMMPATFIGLYPIKAKAWMMAVPTLGQTLLVNDLMRGEAGPTTWILLAGLGALAGAAACLAVTIRLLGQEKIVFGR